MSLLLPLLQNGHGASGPTGKGPECTTEREQHCNHSPGFVWVRGQASAFPSGKKSHTTQQALEKPGLFSLFPPEDWGRQEFSDGFFSLPKIILKVVCFILSFFFFLLGQCVGRTGAVFHSYQRYSSKKHVCVVYWSMNRSTSQVKWQRQRWS